MATNVLTDRKIAASKPRDKEYLLSDGGGLNLRIRPDDSRSWIYRYTSLAGRPAKKSLGPYPEVKLAAARQVAARFRAALAAGIDPTSAPEFVPNTVNELYDVWLRDSISTRRNAVGVAAVRSRMGRHILPKAGKDRIQSITKARAMGLLAPIAAAGFKAQAKAVFIDFKQMMDYAVERDWLPANALTSIKKASIGGADVVRDRTLSEAEIRLLQEKTRTMSPRGLTVGATAAIWIALSTLARASEIAAAMESEIDWELREWTIPAAKNKSNREHVIQLSDFAFYWLAVMRDRPRQGKYLFPSTRRDSHVKNTSFVHQVTKRQSPDVDPDCSLALPGGPWIMHDLRRTGATLMGELGIAEAVVEKCLNHAEQNKLVKVYQRQKLLVQRRDAFQALGAHLTALAGDPNDWGPGRRIDKPGSDNVVSIRKSA
jgi:integrase